MRLIPAFLTLALLGGCVSSPKYVVQDEPPPSRPTTAAQVPPAEPAPPQVAGFRQPQIMSGPGLSGVIRENAPALTARFGQPRLDVREGDMRKLQFTGTACVLDIFLYPLAQGAEPVATWIEARRASDGQAVDRTACIQALSGRR